jgi:hypothetical protein
MKTITIKGSTLKFDDYTVDDDGHRWTQVCQAHCDHLEKEPTDGILSLGEGARCGVEGCEGDFEDKPMYYFDFGAAPCPVCNSENVRPDLESPQTMSCCEKCGSEWVREGHNGELEITLDARDHATEEENEKFGRNPK